MSPFLDRPTALGELARKWTPEESDRVWATLTPISARFESHVAPLAGLAQARYAQFSETNGRQIDPQFLNDDGLEPQPGLFWVQWSLPKNVRCVQLPWKDPSRVFLASEEVIAEDRYLNFLPTSKRKKLSMIVSAWTAPKIRIAFRGCRNFSYRTPAFIDPDQDEWLARFIQRLFSPRAFVDDALSSNDPDGTTFSKSPSWLAFPTNILPNDM